MILRFYRVLARHASEYRVLARMASEYLALALVLAAVVSCAVPTAASASRGPVDASVIVKESLDQVTNSMMDNTKRAVLMSGAATESGRPDAGKALDWTTTQIVFYGISGLDRVRDAFSGDNLKARDDAAVSLWIDGMLESYVGTTGDSEETVSEKRRRVWEKWESGGDVGAVLNELKSLAIESHAILDMDSITIRGAEGLGVISENLALTRSRAGIAANTEGIVGLDAESGSLFDRMRSVGMSLLVIALIVRLGLMMYRFSLGERDESAVREVLKYVAVGILIMNVDILIWGGIDFVDAIRDTILGGDAAEKYSIMEQSLEIRAQYSSAGNASWFKLGAAEIFAILAALLARAVVFILLVMGDVMMAITSLTAPLVMALSLLPSFEDYMSKWFKSLVTFLMYPIAAAVYTALMTALVATNVDTSSITLILVSVCYLLGALQIPNIAEAMNGAALAGVAAAVATAPMKMAKSAAGAAAGVATMGLSSLVGKGADAVGDAAKGAVKGRGPAT